MRKLLIVMLSFFCCAASIAAEPLVLRDVADGTYLLTVSKGVVTLEPAREVRVNPSPTPNPQPDPITPSPTDTLTQTVVAAVNKVAASDKRHEVAMKLSKVYEMLAGQAIPPAKAVEATDKIVALALGSDAVVLSGACSVVDAALKKTTTEAGVTAVLKEAGAALATTVPVTGDDDEKATAKRYGFDMDKFLAFLMQLLQLLLPIILKI